MSRPSKIGLSATHIGRRRGGGGGGWSVEGGEGEVSGVRQGQREAVEAGPRGQGHSWQYEIRCRIICITDLFPYSASTHIVIMQHEPHRKIC